MLYLVSYISLYVCALTSHSYRHTCVQYTWLYMVWLTFNAPRRAHNHRITRYAHAHTHSHTHAHTHSHTYIVVSRLVHKSHFGCSASPTLHPNEQANINSAYVPLRPSI